MFYSQLLLLKKGTFGTIWVAAHCHKKLKKDQINHTNISASVDKILKDGVPSITYRILAYLLLGVVRIYSKKVEYLFHDCRDVLSEICQFARNQQTFSNLEGTCVPESTRKKRATTASVEAICAPYSMITLPEKFELDSFDLEIVDNVRGDHVKSREAITLNDSWEDDGSGHYSLEKDCFVKDNVTSEVHHETFSPPSELKRNPSPVTVEKLRDDNRFLLEERLDPMILSEGEEESAFGGESGGKHGKFVLPEMMVEEESELQDDGSNYGAQNASEEKAIPSEMNSGNNEKLHDFQDHYPPSLTIDATPDLKMPNILVVGSTSKAGAVMPESMAVRTPAPKERPRLSRKRQRAFDDDFIVIPNLVYKGWMDDCSDLVCKRRKVPHTEMHVWKAHRMSNLSQCFLEPLIPIPPVGLKSLTSTKKVEVSEPPKTREMSSKPEGLDTMKTSGTPAKADFLGSPPRRFLEEEIIAPSTPVTHSTSVRFNELRVTTNSNKVGPTSSHESIEKELSPSGNRELDKVFIDEEEVNSNGDSEKNDEWSTRTRIVAGYLQKNFVNRKKRGKEESLSLFQVLKGKTKKESARLFYELLVMKTGGFVEVKQDEPYGDIVVMECEKLKKAGL